MQASRDLTRAISRGILQSGFLFAASEAGNHGFYQFQGVGDDDDAPGCSSAAFEAGDETVVELEPRPLANLLHVDDISSLCPLIDAKVRSRDACMHARMHAGRCRSRELTIKLIESSSSTSRGGPRRRRSSRSAAARRARRCA